MRGWNAVAALISSGDPAFLFDVVVSCRADVILKADLVKMRRGLNSS